MDARTLFEKWAEGLDPRLDELWAEDPPTTVDQNENRKTFQDWGQEATEARRRLWSGGEDLIQRPTVLRAGEGFREFQRAISKPEDHIEECGQCRHWIEQNEMDGFCQLHNKPKWRGKKPCSDGEV